MKNKHDGLNYFKKSLCLKQRKRSAKKPGFIFEKVLDFRNLLWYVVVLTEKEAQPMKSRINELWHGNIVPQEDIRTNSPEMKELLGYMSRHHEDLEKSFTDEQKETFEKFHDCRSEYMSLARRQYSSMRSNLECILPLKP